MADVAGRPPLLPDRVQEPAHHAAALGRELRGTRALRADGDRAADLCPPGARPARGAVLPDALSPTEAGSVGESRRPVSSLIFAAGGDRSICWRRLSSRCPSSPSLGACRLTTRSPNSPWPMACESSSVRTTAVS